ncbi:MAG: hypothetical protein ACHQ3P_01330 [Candidatus Limnocylindrales bacterium]
MPDDTHAAAGEPQFEERGFSPPPSPDSAKGFVPPPFRADDGFVPPPDPVETPPIAPVELPPAVVVVIEAPQATLPAAVPAPAEDS